MSRLVQLPIVAARRSAWASRCFCEESCLHARAASYEFVAAESATIADLTADSQSSSASCCPLDAVPALARRQNRMAATAAPAASCAAVASGVPEPLAGSADGSLGWRSSCCAAAEAMLGCSRPRFDRLVKPPVQSARN